MPRKHDGVVVAFLEAACVPHGEGSPSHASGTLEEAERIRAAHPEVATGELYAAAVLGEEAAVRGFLAADPGAARRRGGPFGWDPLTYLCFSRYLRLDPKRSAGFVGAARALLDAGADPNTGFFEGEHQPKPERESVLYGAAGIAHHAELTRLLLERGADPNDEEVPYHAPEGYDNAALRILVESGRLPREKLAWMLIRKADWHDTEGLEYLVTHGADPNLVTRFGITGLHQALRRDNRLKNVEVLLSAGADPGVRTRDGLTAVSIAARRGRGDVLELFERRGVRIELSGVERLIAACAMDDGAAVRAMRGARPELAGELVAQGGTLLAEFAGNDNAAGAGQLLDLGVDVNAGHATGDGYWGIPKGSSALHVAAWRAAHGAVRLLVGRRAAVNARDADGRTPLALAIRACVDSWWSDRRSPDSIAALLRAGASTSGIPFPTGYDEADRLLEQYGRTA